MSVTIRQRLAKGLRWTARVIGLSGTVFYLFYWFVSSQFGDSVIRSGAASIFLTATVIIALEGCIISWWREWLAGVLFIISWLVSFGVVVRKIGHPSDGADWWLGVGLPLLVAGCYSFCPGGFQGKLALQHYRHLQHRNYILHAQYR